MSEEPEVVFTDPSPDDDLRRWMDAVRGNAEPYWSVQIPSKIDMFIETECGRLMTFRDVYPVSIVNACGEGPESDAKRSSLKVKDMWFEVSARDDAQPDV